MTSASSFEGFEGYELIRHDAPILHEVMPDFDFTAELAFDVAKKMYEFLSKVILDKGALGVSANQLGIRARMFVMRSDPMICCINPTITYESPEKVLLDEGCLSYPFLYLRIERPKQVRLKWFDPTGQIQTQMFDGMSARIVQHELDHLNGINFMSRAKPMARMLAVKKQKDMLRMQQKIKLRRK